MWVRSAHQDQGQPDDKILQEPGIRALARVLPLQEHIAAAEKARQRCFRGMHATGARSSGALAGDLMLAGVLRCDPTDRGEKNSLYELGTRYRKVTLFCSVIFGTNVRASRHFTTEW